MTNIRALLAQNIKKRRKNLGFSQAVLAEKSGSSVHYIAQIERQKRFPSSEMIERLAAALDIDTPDLFAVKQFKDEAVSQVRERIQADIGALSAALSGKIDERLNGLRKS